jgi:hypothetical protein
VLIGGTGPKTLALAGEIADGVILDSQYTPTTVRDAIDHVSSGRPGGHESPFSTVLFVSCNPDQVNTSVAPYVEAGVNTLVFQPVGPQTVLPELITAAGKSAPRR